MGSDVSDIAVVVITYTRLTSFSRVIKSLQLSDYEGDVVDLIISIDNDGTDAISDYAKSIFWPHGNIRIIKHPNRLGLKKHVLSCGDLTKIYSSICVFEDDIYASPGFYGFAKRAVSEFSSNEMIAGISLYTPQWNQYVDRPFVSLDTGLDVFSMQVASSWGQVWTRNSWDEFRAWLKDKEDKDLHFPLLPAVVANWSKKSWLKFHNAYLAATGKYFIYPKVSLATNFSDDGEHARSNSVYQVPLLARPQREYRFNDRSVAMAKYDAYFESQNMFDVLGINPNEIDVNLYGNKPLKKRFVLSLNPQGFAIEKSFGMSLRPMELNVILSIPGSEIFLLDTHKKRSHSFRQNILNSSLKLRVFMYETRTSAKFYLILSGLYLYGKAIAFRAKRAWHSLLMRTGFVRK